MEEFDMPEDDFEKLYEEELQLMNEISALEDVEADFTTVKENIDNNCANVEVKEASTFKKRIHEDSSHLGIEEKAIKRRKQSFPLFGYDEKVTIDNDIATIDRIVCNRKAAQDNNHSTPYSLKTGSSNSKLRKAKFHYSIPNGDFQSITTESGKRVYLDVQEENNFEASVAGVGVLKESAHMLSLPYTDLRMEAEKELLFLNPEVITEENATAQQTIDGSENCNEVELWVNKYKPRTYLDLLSDEFTNRTVLQWIKLWDKVVFGIDPKQNQKKRDKTKAKPEYFNKFGPEIVHEFDDLGRPQQKVLLLSGPPGLGKTTLAHIIAAHAGYNVVEMNASDDRSVDTFRMNLENATTMKTVFGTDKRPNCLIIDEIDGAPSPSINLLVNLLQSKKSKDDFKSKKKNNFLLFRPVVCICNDLYVPSLRPLKQIALVIQFPPTHSTKLAQRLHSITQKQLLKADLSVLLALCSKTENDIRACLSTLQFIRIKAKELKLQDLEKASVGQKDYQRSMFSIWNYIFTLPRPKRGHGFNSNIQHSNGSLNKKSVEKSKSAEHLDVTSPGSRFNNILKMAQACGEYEKLSLGWFENYLLMKFKHVYLEPVVAGLEWVTLTDILQKEILKSQTWNLGAYIPFSFAAYHFLFASNTWQPLKFPNQYNEFLSNLTKSQSLLDMMTRGMSAEAQVFSSNKCIVQDTLPYLTFILQPNLRPVNVQLFSKKEKEALSRLVDSMISYNLTYLQEKNAEGSYSFSLDPNIEDIVQFSSIPKRRSIPYASKQLIAREIELEKVRRSEQYFGAETKERDCPETSTKHILKTSELLKSKRAMEQTNQGRVNKKEPFKPIQAKENEKKIVNIPHTSNVVARDFFGRLISSSVEEEMLSSQSAILRSDIWFKFKEGYSNAVRRPVRVQDFL